MKLNLRPDNKPIITKVKLPLPDLKAIHEDDPNPDVCTCSNKCQIFERIPADEGIMIMMHEPLQSRPQDEGAKSCTCLKIEPQSDSNLKDIHPNIYIPSSLLDYPEHIVKYGGGGSGVTVFGGYHPQLGSLVMKHGGPKDLLELVSLYKIERELSVRGKTKLGLLGVTENSEKRRSRKTIFPNLGLLGKGNQSRKSILLDLPRGASTVVKKISGARVGSIFKGTYERDSAPNLDEIGVSTDESSSNTDSLAMASSCHALSSMQKTGESGDCDGELQAIEIERAMEDMKQRIPAFRMLYISPMHLRERRGELVNRTFRQAGYTSSVVHSFDGDDALASSMTGYVTNGNDLRSSIRKQGRSICLFGSAQAACSSVRVHSAHVDLCFGGSYRVIKEDGAVAAANESVCNDQSTHSCPNPDDEENDGYTSLMSFVNQLYHHMTYNNWKLTLSQQTIGKSTDDPTKSAPTASSLLAQGKLKGPLLQHLMDEEINVIRNLQILTMPDEVDVLDGVRMEYESIKARMNSPEGHKVTAADVSTIADNFVGKAIIKNFHPVTGRFVLLRQFGIDLRDGKIHLKPKEVVPATHLEKILNGCFGTDAGKTEITRRRSSLEDVFDFDFLDEEEEENYHKTPEREDPLRDPLRGNPLYIHGLDQWQPLLELALSIKNPNATSRIWTCGLTDGGLHNLFLDEEQIWLFDLGEPTLETIPGFLTKFLMSFFHTLGMEEDTNGDWVVRFEQDADILRLTPETQELLPSVCQTFNVVMDRLINDLFDGDDEVRLLLLRYVMMQLVSDASFCIEKWRVKGGGDKERSEHQYYLEKWLWRALWDVYACEEIRRRYMKKEVMKNSRRDEQRCFHPEDLRSSTQHSNGTPYLNLISKSKNGC